MDAEADHLASAPSHREQGGHSGSSISEQCGERIVGRQHSLFFSEFQAGYLDMEISSCAVP